MRVKTLKIERGLFLWYKAWGIVEDEEDKEVVLTDILCDKCFREVVDEDDYLAYDEYFVTVVSNKPMKCTSCGKKIDDIHSLYIYVQ